MPVWPCRKWSIVRLSLKGVVSDWWWPVLALSDMSTIACVTRGLKQGLVYSAPRLSWTESSVRVVALQAQPLGAVEQPHSAAFIPSMIHQIRRPYPSERCPWCISVVAELKNSRHDLLFQDSRSSYGFPQLRVAPLERLLFQLNNLS